MDEKSLFAVRHWGIGKLFLIAVACFAVAAIVFYIATWLQQFAPGSLNQNTAVQMSDEDKRRVLDSLNQNTAAQMYIEDKQHILDSLSDTSSSEQSSGGGSAQTPGTSSVSPSPAANDANTAAKLKILESLNAN